MSRKKTKRRLKKYRSRRRSLGQSLKKRFAKRFPDSEVISGPTSDGVKMSEVLERFVDPYEQYAETEEAYRKLLTTALVAWNVMLYPEKHRSYRLDELLTTLPENVREEGRQVIQELMVRKERFFSQYKRMIVDYEVADIGSKKHLSVMSMASPARDEND